MNYLQRNKKQTQIQKRNQIIFVVLLIIVLFFAGSKIRAVVQIINGPIITAKNAVVSPLNSFFSHFRSKGNLVDQNQTLDQENKKLKIELLTLDSVRDENSELKRLLNYVEPSPAKILAKVLNKPPFSPYDTFIIDAGSAKTFGNGGAISVGDDVSYNNIPVGTVSEVYKNTSVVKLYSSSGQKIPISIDNKTEAEAVGTAGGGFKITIPKDVLVEVGNTITFRGQIIGVIAVTEFEESNTFQNVYFKYPFKLQDLNWVEVLQHEQ